MLRNDSKILESKICIGTLRGSGDQRKGFTFLLERKCPNAIAENHITMVIPVSQRGLCRGLECPGLEIFFLPIVRVNRAKRVLK